MPVLSDVVKAQLVLNKLPDSLCLETWLDLVKMLPELLSVEVPSTITNVIVSNVQPLDSQRNSVWFRYSNAGVFMGIYIFSGSTWTQIFPLLTGVYWVYSTDGSAPLGYQKIDGSNSTVVAAVGLGAVNALAATYIQDATSTFDCIFACSWIGF